MKYRVLNKYALITLSGIVVSSMEAAVQIDVSSNADSANFVWTLSDLNGSSPSIAVNTGGATVSGVFAGQGQFQVGESFSLSFRASTEPVSSSNG